MEILAKRVMVDILDIPCLVLSRVGSRGYGCGNTNNRECMECVIEW
jgi:hypothetical protein